MAGLLLLCFARLHGPKDLYEGLISKVQERSDRSVSYLIKIIKTRQRFRTLDIDSEDRRHSATTLSACSFTLLSAQAQDQWRRGLSPSLKKLGRFSFCSIIQASGSLKQGLTRHWLYVLKVNHVKFCWLGSHPLGSCGEVQTLPSGQPSQKSRWVWWWGGGQGIVWQHSLHLWNQPFIERWPTDDNV